MLKANLLSHGLILKNNPIVDQLSKVAEVARLRGPRILSEFGYDRILGYTPIRKEGNMMKRKYIQTNWQTNFSLLLTLLTVFALLLLSNSVVEAGKMYWTDMRGIHRAEQDGGGTETLIPVTLSYPLRVAVDAVGGKIYWTDSKTNKIQRANFDGTNVKDIVTGLINPYGIAVDATSRKIYWADGNTDKIQRANFDGTDVEDIVITGLINPSSIAVDVDGGKIYWRSGRDKIQRANLDGTDVEDIVTMGSNFSYGIAVDATGGKIYWTDYVTHKIRRADLDGTNVEDIVTTGLDYPWDIAVDSGGGKIYWTDIRTLKIQRANLDGTEIEDIVKMYSRYGSGIAVDAVGGKIYWTDIVTYPVWSPKIRCANLNGADIEDIVTTNLSIPECIAVDSVRKKMYWTDSGTDKIQRANLNGTNIEDIITTGSGFPYGIAVDTAGGKIYWTDWNSEKILRANLDGTDIEGIVTKELIDPKGIAVDMVRGKIYWTDAGRWSPKIQRANFDGTDIEDIITTGLINPSGIAVDADGKKIYWADGGTDKIQRANFDGTDIEDIITTGLDSPYGIAVDAEGGNIYWTDWDSETGKIQRANLDGTGVEDLVTGLVGPRYIALDLPVTPIADFSVDLTSGYAPLTVQFTDTSMPAANPITNWSWDFDNDGTVDSDEQTPTYTYAKAGTYTVKLTISDGTLSDDEIKVDYITVDFPIGDLSGDSTVSAYDAALLLQFVVGLIDEFPVVSMMGSSPENAIPRHYEVSVPSLGVAEGQHIAVPIQINDATGFLAGGVSLKYDATVLKAVGASLELNGAYWQANTNIDGEVRVAFAKTAKTGFSHSGSWILFVVRFDALANTEGKISPLILDYVQLAESLSIKKVNGLVTILPSEFRLHQNYPNPFNPETWIPYDLAADANVEIIIYNTQGHQIRMLMLGVQPAGSYLAKDKAAYWDGLSETGELVSSGIYFYHLRVGDFHATRKMIILK